MNDHAGRLRQSRGQASVEYLVVASCIALVLVVASGTAISPADALVNALKSYFGAYSFALSLP